MNRLFFLLLIGIFFTSCAFMRESGEHRSLQTEILNKITSKSSEFAVCAKNGKIYQKLGRSRVRVVLHINIDSHGVLEKFQLDDKEYPSEFADCVFQTLELISFPSNKENKLVDIEQPFIFSKKP